MLDQVVMESERLVTEETDFKVFLVSACFFAIPGEASGAVDAIVEEMPGVSRVCDGFRTRDAVVPPRSDSA